MKLTREINSAVEWMPHEGSIPRIYSIFLLYRNFLAGLKKKFRRWRKKSRPLVKTPVLKNLVKTNFLSNLAVPKKSSLGWSIVNTYPNKFFPFWVLIFVRPLSFLIGLFWVLQPNIRTVGSIGQKRRFSQKIEKIHRQPWGIPRNFFFKSCRQKVHDTVPWYTFSTSFTRKRKKSLNVVTARCNFVTGGYHLVPFWWAKLSAQIRNLDDTQCHGQPFPREVWACRIKQYSS